METRVHNTATAASLPAAGTFNSKAARFAALLGVLLLALLITRPAGIKGDAPEYVLTTIAIASHGSPDIRLADIEQGRVLAPPLQGHLDGLEHGIRSGQPMPFAGFYRSTDGTPYAIHYFAYSALAAVPFKLLQLAGLPPLRCFQVVNLAMVLVLGLSLLRLYGGVPRALAGVGLYMLCGGLLYWNWSSPECLSAAALLAGLCYFASGAPLRGGVLIGIASLQNPTIVLTLGAVPPLLCCLHYQARNGFLANAHAALRPRIIAGLVLGAALFALAPLFNWQKFGVPSIIAQISTAKELISLVRLHSMFFDLNQGMLVAMPALAVVLLCTGWRGATGGERIRRAMALLLCIVLTVAYAVPALSVHNWNSAAAGVMRYAFWAAMPFLFLLLWRLRSMQRWPSALLAGLVLVQALAMTNADRYNELHFSPLAKLVMRYAPAMYNPEPEIFAERTSNAEASSLDHNKVHRYTANGITLKTMYNSANPNPGAGQCQDGQALSNGGLPVATARGWLYLNGPVHCVNQLWLGPAHAQPGAELALGHGWSGVERPEGNPAGVWSDGNDSALQITYPQSGAYRQIVISGHYLEGNRQTRVKINGVDLGWHDLQSGMPLPLPQAAGSTSLRLELSHQNAHSPGPQDGRNLAFYLQGVALQ